MLHSTRRLNHKTTNRIYCQRELTCIKVTSPITKKIKGRGKLSYLFKLAHWYFMSDDRSNINSVKNQAQINLNVFKIKARMVIKFIEILVGSSLWSFSLGNRSMAGQMTMAFNWIKIRNGSENHQPPVCQGYVPFEAMYFMVFGTWMAISWNISFRNSQRWQT